MNTSYATSGRCVGSDPLTPDDDPSTMDKVTLKFKNVYTGSTVWGYVVGDVNYSTDYNSMKAATKRNSGGIHNLGKSYWLASRWSDSSASGGYVDVRIVDSDGVSTHNNYLHFIRASDSHSFYAQYSHGLRPIVTLISDIQTSSGDGSESNPFKLVAQ